MTQTNESSDKKPGGDFSVIMLIASIVVIFIALGAMC
jgi:hypothetical protein